MKLVDVNLLVYAVDRESLRHEPARAWVEEALSGIETVALPWHTLIGFVRLVTRSAVMTRPLAADEAFDYVDEWLDQPCATVVHPTERHSALVRGLLRSVGTAGNRTSDAHLAALAIEHDAQLCSADADFSRFPGLRWHDPLRSSPRQTPPAQAR